MIPHAAFFSFAFLIDFLQLFFIATQDLEQKATILLNNELNKFRKLLSPDYPACSEREVEDQEDQADQSPEREAVLKITLHILEEMNHSDLANKLQSSKCTLHHSITLLLSMII